jgi:beta-galactosidase
MKLVEVADQKNTDTGANRAPKGVLAIVEAEFYEAVQ